MMTTPLVLHTQQPIQLLKIFQKGQKNRGCDLQTEDSATSRGVLVLFEHYGHKKNTQKSSSSIFFMHIL